MNFTDYYELLELKPPATQEEIKKAYRTASLKWHPDTNLGTDTTEIMQLINEAYLILKDEEAKSKYDNVYSHFKQQQSQEPDLQPDSMPGSEKFEFDSKRYEYNYEFSDETLKQWMSNARRQSHSMTEEMIDELRGATKEAGKSIGNAFLKYFIPMIIGFLLFKMCSSL